MVLQLFGGKRLDQVADEDPELDLLCARIGERGEGLISCQADKKFGYRASPMPRGCLASRVERLLPVNRVNPKKIGQTAREVGARIHREVRMFREDPSTLPGVMRCLIQCPSRPNRCRDGPF